ncbi:hypothetical protein AMELA_G00242130 [Ameiurus melas]|uniref:Ig-like domain-containing protein n=1 Tax=Ameiurus melas TaxID=219545 RepID=A0A7J5ZVN1_AMEME|nr:hypothetical protein AMELA_G00242130 [Ameiurus melas]
MIRFITLVIFIVLCWRVSADTHCMQYFYTAIIPERNFTPGAVVDGEVPKCPKVKADDPQCLKQVTHHLQKHQDLFQNTVAVVTPLLNPTKGVHTLQVIYGCELYDNSTTKGYMQYGYDGEDFISLDRKTGTWTAANDKAELFMNKCGPTGAEAKYWKDFLDTDCIDWMNKVLTYSRETLERKVRPTASVFQKHSFSPEVVCHATGFFPKTVNITWQKDGEDVHEDVDLRETLPNQDGSFQKRSVLNVSAEDLQKHTYTCMIQHSSLEKEIVLHEEDIRILNPGGGSNGGSGGVNIGIIVGVVMALMALIVPSMV